MNFTIEAGLKDKVSTEELTSIANSNTDTENITILDVGYTEPSKMESLTGITFITPPIKSYTAHNVFESDRFMDSCAKGETKTLQYTITEKLTAKVTGDIKIGSLDIVNEISYSLTKGQILVGPPENKRENSREYRCKFYQNEGTWVQIGQVNGTPFNLNGKFKEPSKYISYSKDTIVS